MQPILFEFGPLTVYSYGAFVVLGFGAATLAAYLLARRAKLPLQRIVDYALVAGFGGLLGARLWYLLLRPEEAGGFWNWFAIGGGRLALAGGIAGGVAGLLYMLHRQGGADEKHISIWRWLDLAALAALLGLAVGRIGSFLNGDFVGTATGVPWAANYEDRLALLLEGKGSHPLAVYASVLYLLIGAYGYRLWKLGAGKAKPGLVFWSVTFLLGAVQVVLEGWHQAEDALRIGGFRASVLTGLVLMAVSLYVLTRRYRVGLAR